MPLLLLAGCFALLGRPGVAQDKNEPKYDIKVYKDRKGDKSVVVKDEEMVQKMTLKDPDGQVIKEATDKSTSNSRYLEEILERQGDKRPTRVRRTYEKAEASKDGMKMPVAYAGKAVLIEKTGANYTFTVDGKALTADEARDLAKEFNKPDNDSDLEKLILPGRPVAVGETWKVEVAPVIKELTKDTPLKVDQAKATVTGKLVRAYKKDGKTFGVLEITMDFPILSVGEAPMVIVFKDGARLTMISKMDVCIDGTSPVGVSNLSMTFKGDGSLKGPDGKDYGMRMEMQSTEVERHEEAR